MPNYQNSKIYVIESLEGKCKYYGSTIQSLALRLGKHKTDIKRGRNSPAKKVLEYSDHNIVLVELYPCDSKMELDARKSHYIRNNECVNKCIPEMSSKEYQQQYYETHRNKLLEYRMAKITCGCGALVSRRNIGAHKKSKKHINNLTPV